jgi:hypothetical protein
MIRKLCLVILFFFISNSCANSQELPQAPKVESKQKTESTLNTKQDANKRNNQTYKSAIPLPKTISNIENLPAKQQGENTTEQGNEYWPIFFGVRIKITDSLLCLFTLFLWWSTRRLVSGAESTAERQLRAYCLVAKAEITNIELGKQPKAIITIKNSGQTPAKNFWQIAVMGYDAFPTEKLGNPDFRKAKKVEHPLPPQGYFTIEIPLSEPIRVQQHIDDLVSGGAAIYVVGEVRYKDAFGKKRITKYKVFAGGAIGLRSSGMAPYHEGNDYT